MNTRKKSLFLRIALRNTVILFLTSLLFLAGTLGLMTLNIIDKESKRLQNMVALIEERVTHAGKPSRIAFADIMLRDGLEFALYREDGVCEYLSSYSMSPGGTPFFDTRIDIVDHVDYTTFADESRKKDIYVHVFRPIQVSGTPYYLYVVSDISYLMEVVGSLPPMLLIGMMLCLFFSVMLGRWMSRQALVPVRDISAQIASKTSENLFERMEEKGVDAEFCEIVRAFNALMERLEASYMKQCQFISDASHELRTPIAVLQGHIQMLDRWGKRDPQVLEDSLRVLKREIRGMNEMVHHLLLLGKADRGMLGLSTARVCISEMLCQAREDALLLSPQSIICVHAPQDLFYECDGSMLQQILRILLDNSVRYCPPPGEIRLSAWEDAGTLFIRVFDEGRGIAPEALPHIFDRFYRADPVDSSGSGNSGLGLAIAKSLTECLGGEIRAQSEEGAWTRLQIALPRKNADG